MSQISRPFQVALIAVVVFALLWLVALRPKPGGDEAAAPATPTAQAQPAAGQQSGSETSLGQARDGAQNAGQAQNDAARRAGADPNSVPPAATPDGGAAGSAGGSATATPPAAPGVPSPPSTKPVEPDAGLPPQAAKALAARKVLVLMFYNLSSPDDRTVRREVTGLSRRGGRVVVMTSSIRNLGRFAAITNAVQVIQSPTVVVVDRERRASSITGFVDRVLVDEVVRDALA